MLSKQNKQDIFALLLARYPKKKAIPMEEIQKYLEENGLQFQEFGYQNIESLLTDLKEFLELKITQGKGKKEANCFLHDYQEVKTKPPVKTTKVPSKKEAAKKTKTIVTKKEEDRTKEKGSLEKDILSALFRKNLYSLGKEYPLATLSKTLTEGGIDCHKYGFGKMKTMLKSLPEDFRIRDVELKGIPQPFVTILKAPEKALPVVKREEKSSKKTAPEEKVDDFFIPDILFLAFKESVHPGLDDQTIKRQIHEDYLLSRTKGTLEKREEGTFFPLRFLNQQGEKLYALVRKSDSKTPYRYYLNYIGPDKDKPKEYLRNMVHFNDLEKDIKALAQLARKEDWCYHNSKDHYIILKIYLQYTFYRLVTQKKIKVDEKSGFACFNTGLVTNDYEPIYAVLLKNQDKSIKEDYLFQGFSIAGIQGYGKIIVEHFSPLPEKATYFDDPNVLYLPPDVEIHSDIPHILKDNLDRFPLNYLEKLSAPFEDIHKVILQIKKEKNDTKIERLYNTLSEKVQKSDLFLALIKTALEMAIRRGIRMIRYDNHLLLPTFFPTRNVFSLLLPLSFESDDKVDAVLILEKTQSGNYQGQTILTLKQSYVNSRLIAPLEHSYLKAHEIED